MKGPLQKEKEKNLQLKQNRFKNIFLKCSITRDILIFFFIPENYFSSPVPWVCMNESEFVKVLFIVLKDFPLVLIQK